MASPRSMVSIDFLPCSDAKMDTRKTPLHGYSLLAVAFQSEQSCGRNYNIDHWTIRNRINPGYHFPCWSRSMSMLLCGPCNTRSSCRTQHFHQLGLSAPHVIRYRLRSQRCDLPIDFSPLPGELFFLGFICNFHPDLKLIH